MTSKSIRIGAVAKAAALVIVATSALPLSPAAAQAPTGRAQQAAAKRGPAAQLAGKAAAKGNSEEPVPLDLSAFHQMKAEDFDKSKQYPWPAVPRGSQTLAGVPVEIQGATMLFGQRNADRGQIYPESITGIPCDQKFAALYILHGVFYEGAKGEPSFEVVLNYQGGEKQADAILCGDDTRGWFVQAGEKMLGPSGKRSTLAWTGTGKFNQRDQPIRFCLTAIENKYPERLVATIDLVSSKKQSAGCILAITVGKAGLLKPLPDKPAGSPPTDK